MIQDFFCYFKIRGRELPVWLGIPYLGFFSAELPGSFKKFLLFNIMIIFGMVHLILLNDWGGLKRNPLELNRYDLEKKRHSLLEKEIFFAACVCVIVAFLSGLYLYSPDILPGLIFLGFLGLLFSLFYSHPVFHWKESLWGAKVLHFLGGIVQFLLGYCVFGSSPKQGIIMGIFFSLIFTAGHFIHECLDEKEDRKNYIRTWVVQKSMTSALRGAYLLFFLTHIYLLILTLFHIVPLGMLLIFSLPVIGHIVFLQKYSDFTNWTYGHIKNFQKTYRMSYGICSCVYICFMVLR